MFLTPPLFLHIELLLRKRCIVFCKQTFEGFGNHCSTKDIRGRDEFFVEHVLLMCTKSQVRHWTVQERTYRVGKVSLPNLSFSRNENPTQNSFV